MESFVAIMALVAAISIDRGIYFAMNSPAALTGGTVETAAAWVNSLGLSGVNISPSMLARDGRQDVGEESIVSRTGGAPTLAVGLAHIMQQFIGGTAMMSFWYHFAIMFEALFILTAVDAGTRVARFMLQDSIGNFVPKFKEHSWRPGAWLCTAVMVAAWGAVLMMGVTDPLGGINTLFPLFGIANQLLAAIALSVCLAIAAKRGAFKYLWIVAVPLAFAAVVTITASFQKIFSLRPGGGLLRQQRSLLQGPGGRQDLLRDGQDGAAMEAVVRNTAIQGWLSVIFVVLSIIVIITAMMATIKAFRKPRPVWPTPTTRIPRCRPASSPRQGLFPRRPSVSSWPSGTSCRRTNGSKRPATTDAGAGHERGTCGLPGIRPVPRRCAWVRTPTRSTWQHHAAAGHDRPPMTEREFWRDQTDRQDTNPQGRCC